MVLKNWTTEGVDPADVNKNNAFIFNQIFATSEAASRTTADGERYLRSVLGGSLQDYNNCTCFSKGDVAFVDSLYDSFDDGAINTDIWTTATTGNGTVTEEGTGRTGYLQLNSVEAAIGLASAIADDTANDAINFQDGTDREVLINFSIDLGSVGSSGKVQISNGTTHIDLISPATGTDRARGTIRLVFDNTGTQVYLFEGLDDTTGSAVDLSTVTTNWFLRFIIDTINVPSDANIKVYQIGIADGSETETNYFSAAQSISSSNIGVFKLLSHTSIPTATARMSFNNGANYTAVLIGVTANALNVESMTAGTQLILNIIGRTPASINVNSTNAQSITGDLLQVIYD